MYCFLVTRNRKATPPRWRIQPMWTLAKGESCRKLNDGFNEIGRQADETHIYLLAFGLFWNARKQLH